MKSVCWAFRRSHPDRAAFVQAVRDYHIGILKTDERWRPDDVVIPAPRVSIIYDYWEGENQLDRVATFDADDGRGFTAGELLWKINEDAAPRLQQQDHVFFEGLGLNAKSAEPAYYMRLGS
jgi:hypothetical protein